MKTLIVEDDFVSRTHLQELLFAQGVAHVAVNGAEAIQAFEAALNEQEPYDLICLDILMPGMDGKTTLREIRRIETERQIPNAAKIIMTTSVNTGADIIAAFHDQCDAYLIKPVQEEKLFAHLREMQLV